MFADARESAFEVLQQLDELADWFAYGSSGRRALRRAARQIRGDYILTRPAKKQLVFAAVAQHHRRASDIERVTGLRRAEIIEICGELEAAGHIQADFEPPTHDGRGGRPVRVFEPSPEVLKKVKITSE